MQCAAQIQPPDELHIFPVLIHHEKLQARTRESLRRLEAIAIARERDLATRQRTRPHVQDAIAEDVLRAGSCHRIWRPIARRSVRCPLLMGQPLNDSSGKMDPVNIRARRGQKVALIVQRRDAHIGKKHVVTPLRIEGEEGIGHRAIARRDEHLLRAIGMPQHQVRTRIDARRMKDLRPFCIHQIAKARLTHIYDVIRHDRSLRRRFAEKAGEETASEHRGKLRRAREQGFHGNGGTARA